MKDMWKLDRKKKLDKKAISLIVAYVLLITIAIALSALVYSWLRFYVGPSQNEECPEGVALIIQDYDYDDRNNNLSLTLQNKGRFNVTGFIVRVSDKPNAGLGVYTLKNEGISEAIRPGGIFNGEFVTNKDKDNKTIKDDLTFLEVQPIIHLGGEELYCDQVAKQDLA
jgi:hypothetical protein